MNDIQYALAQPGVGLHETSIVEREFVGHGRSDAEPPGDRTVRSGEIFGERLRICEAVLDHG